MTTNLPSVMLDDPGPFETLERWEQFLAEVQAMPGFLLKESVVEHAKWMIAQKKQELAARRGVTGYRGCTDQEQSMRFSPSQHMRMATFLHERRRRSASARGATEAMKS
jgi:hypothetical protein